MFSYQVASHQNAYRSYHLVEVLCYSAIYSAENRKIQQAKRLTVVISPERNFCLRIAIFAVFAVFDY